MGLANFWRSYKVLIVMVPGVGLIHWGWFNIRANPLLKKDREEYIPEPSIVTFVSAAVSALAAPLAAPPAAPPAAAKSK